MQYLIAV